MVLTACMEEELMRAVWEGGVACLGLKTWKALVPVPGLFKEEKGRAEEGEVRGEAVGTKPPTSDDDISGECPSELLTLGD
jgi:hypothetical protein